VLAEHGVERVLGVSQRAADCEDRETEARFGMLTFVNPAFFASAVIPAGDMSDVPTICSCLRLLATVERALTPMTIAIRPSTQTEPARLTSTSSTTFRAP
jgi:hypothetical protein